MDVERRRGRRQQVADGLAIGAPIAEGLSLAAIILRVAVEGQSQVDCGSVRDFVVGFLPGAAPILSLGGIALGVVALILGTRLKGAAILGLLSAVVMVPISAVFALTACY
jgi:hypothetical protein